MSKKNKPKSDSMSKLPMPTKLTSPLSRTCKVALMAEKKLPINRTRPFMFIIQYDNQFVSQYVIYLALFIISSVYQNLVDASLSFGNYITEFATVKITIRTRFAIN